MKIKSAKSFRYWYKNLTSARKQAAQFWDENFIGTQHNDLSGFFAMYHGDKTQIYDFLRKEVEMAEDGQAIYEFVQNAADSDSTKFYMFYDEDYLIVINNGSVFSKEGVKSILNIGQSFGKQDPDKIGRYGIGFKLVHRLVGKSSGLDELLNVDKQGHRGPILFSWSEKSQFRNFLKSNEFEYVDFNEDKAPWLFKILITNFPAQPTEKVKDIGYKDIEPFEAEELNSFQTFLNSYIDKIDLDSLDCGTIFFLKLGEKKFEYLERQKQEYLNGLSTSMHFLKSLDTLVINKNVVQKDKEATNVLEFRIQNGSDEFNEIGLTENRDKESDAIFKLCFADNANSANEIKKHPNIYKYFPAVKEVNNLSFVIHSNLFELSSNRQNLTETPINKNLLGLLSKQLINKMEDFKSENRNTFKNIFTSILMSEESSSNYSGNGWQNEYFYNILLEYILKAIPTKGNGFSDNAQNVKINKLNSKLNLDLADFGLSHIEWFEWDKEENKLLIEEAKKDKKLGIEEWDIRDIIENTNLESINNWIANCNENTYEAFLSEIGKIYLREETKTRLFEIKLFKFSDNRFYSINDLWTTANVRETYQERTYNQYKRTYENTTKTRVVQKSILNQSIIFSTDKTSNVSNELQNLGFAVSLKNISTYKDIYSALSEKLPKEKETYNAIAEKCKTNTLSAKEKKALFLNFINEATKLDNVDESTLKDLQLFCDSNSEIKPLNQLINQIKTPSWLNTYKIKQEEYFSELNSFLITEPEDIFKDIYQQYQADIIAELTTAEEIKSLIILYQENQKLFFKEFIIRKENNKFVIDEKTKETYQVQSADKAARKFIDENCADNLFVLPYEFVEKFKDEEGIIKADDLHSLILDFVDKDEHKEILLEIVKYKAKHKFLQDLSEFRFNSETKYSIDDYEYKILDLACNELKENDYKKFKDKVIIETENQEIKLSEIPPFTDNIKIDDYELNLAKLLPDNYENSDHLSSLINQFIGLGLSKERIGNLFGVSEEPEISEIFQIFSEQVETLENAEQLAFLFLYSLYIEKIDFNQFKALNVNEEYVDLGTDKYLSDFNFINQSEILHQKYRGIIETFKEFPVKVEDNDNLLLINEPFFEDDKFVCPYIKEDLSDEEKISLIDFLFNQWNKKNKKTAIKNIDWSKIDDTETVNILGFNPITSVYPSKYACESEALPDYLIKWPGKEESKIDFLTDLGVWTEKSVIVELRKYLSSKIKVFHNNSVAHETRFYESETVLFNSFEWLKEKEIVLKTAEQFETFKKVVAVINDNRGNNNDLRIDEEFDFEELAEKATEWEEPYYVNWKEESNIFIFLYQGELPKYVSLGEIENHIFYYFHEGNTAIDDDNNIYINKNSDIKKELRKLEFDNDNFDFDGLWQNKLEVLENLLKKTNEATLGTKISTDISKNDQKEAIREAKEIVKERLEQEGFEFKGGIGKYSTIDGVFKEDVEFPLVVKSYKYQDEPLKIGANEWKQLMHQNSVFCIHFGNRKIGYLELGKLLRTQDKLTISFSTENLDVEDRLEKFAELLHYFGNVHFDFNSIIPSKVANDFRHFNERRNEEDLTGDDDSLL
jgi:hypothetical protein